MRNRKDLNRLGMAMKKVKNPLKKMDGLSYIDPDVKDPVAESTGVKKVNAPKEYDTEKMNQMSKVIAGQQKEEQSKELVNQQLSGVFQRGGGIVEGSGFDDLSTSDKREAILNKDLKYLYFPG